MLFEIIYYLGNSLSSEDSSTDEVISIGCDRNFIKFNTFNGRIMPDNYANTMTSNFLWDKYFPKPFFYFIKFENHEKDELIKLIKNKSEPEYKIFKVCEDLENKTYKVLESDNVNDEFEYIIICKKENVYSIKKSMEYFCMAIIILPIYEEFLRPLCIFICKIRKLQALKENETALRDVFKNFRDAEVSFIEILNTIAKRCALIKIPSRNDLEMMTSFKEIEDKLYKTFILLLKTFDQYEEKLDPKESSKESSKKIEKSKPRKKKDVFIEFKDYVIRKMLKTEFSKTLDEIKGAFTDFEVFVSEIKTNNSTNTEISLECDPEELKRFIDKYFNLLYKYCEVMENVDVMYLTSYFFSIPESSDCKREKMIEEIYMDQIIAIELKKYLLDFLSDMTDFMIFSQTDYFKKEFSGKILTNIKHLIEANEYKDLFPGDSIVEDKNYNLVDFYNLCFAILYDPHNETVVSMEDLIKDIKNEGSKHKINIGSFLRRYALIILIVIIFGLTVLFIHLQRPSRFIN